jgi:hypothetical protein
MTAAINPNSARHAVRHLEGSAPQSERAAPQSVLPPAEFLVIEADQHGTYLFRYTRKGDFAGDTWHATTDDAIAQAEYEFGIIRTDWRQVPPEVEDVIRYVLSGASRDGTQAC